jgi:hypothetical protein
MEHSDPYPSFFIPFTSILFDLLYNDPISLKRDIFNFFSIRIVHGGALIIVYH